MNPTVMPPSVISVSRSATYTFSKPTQPNIRLIADLGVEGDAHLGVTVKHRSRVRKDPTQPNLRQVHLIHSELIAELNATGFTIHPGQMGENITTANIDLLNLPTGTRLAIGPEAIIDVTGLRNPCQQLNDLQPGLMSACMTRTTEDKATARAGIMAIVLHGGLITPGDPIQITLPPKPHTPLTYV
jgi:MOSC domain-containing protein YiiM